MLAQWCSRLRTQNQEAKRREVRLKVSVTPAKVERGCPQPQRTRIEETKEFRLFPRLRDCCGWGQPRSCPTVLIAPRGEGKRTGDARPWTAAAWRRFGITRLIRERRLEKFFSAVYSRPVKPKRRHVPAVQINPFPTSGGVSPHSFSVFSVGSCSIASLRLGRKTRRPSRRGQTLPALLNFGFSTLMSNSRSEEHT